MIFSNKRHICRGQVSALFHWELRSQLAHSRASSKWGDVVSDWRLLGALLCLIAFDSLQMTGCAQAQSTDRDASQHTKLPRVEVRRVPAKPHPPPATADKIVDFVAITAESKTSLLDRISARQTGGASVIVSRPFADDGHTPLAVRYHNGYWVKIADKLFRNASKRFVSDAVDSLWSAKFAKA